MRRRITFGSITAGVIIIVLAVFAFVQMKEAEYAKEEAFVQKNKALTTQSLFLSDLSRQELERGGTVNGMLLALEALPKDMYDSERPYVFEAEVALYNAVLNHRAYDVILYATEYGNFEKAAFSRNGKHVITLLGNTDNKTAVLWDANTGKQLKVLQNAEIDEYDFSHEPIYTSNGYVEIKTAWFPNKKEKQQQAQKRIDQILKDRNQFLFLSTVFSSTDGTYFVIQQSNRAFTEGYSEKVDEQLWKIKDGKIQPVVILEHQFLERDAYDGREAIKDAVFSPDGQRFITVFENTAYLWHVNRVIQTEISLENAKDISIAALSKGGKKIVAAFDDKTIGLFDVKTGAKLDEFPWDINMTDIAFSSDEKSLIILGKDSIIQFNLKTREKSPIQLALDNVKHIAFSSDKKSVFVLVVENAENVENVEDVENGYVEDVENGYVIQFNIKMNEGTILLDNVEKLSSDANVKFKFYYLIPGEGKKVAAISPNRQLIATREDAETDLDRVVLWDVKTGKTLFGVGRNYRMTFHPNGRHFITNDGDNTSLWDIEKGKKVFNIKGTDYAMSSDGQFMLLKSETDNFFLQRIFSTTQDLIDYANKVVPRCLTAEQREQFFLSEYKNDVLVKELENLASEGNIDAINVKFNVKFKETKELAPCFKSKLVTALIKKGEDLVKQGKIDEAVVKFRYVLKVNPHVVLEPQKYAQILAKKVVQELIEEGEELAREEEREDAIGKF